MGCCLSLARTGKQSKSTHIVVGDIIVGDDNEIIDNTKGQRVHKNINADANISRRVEIGNVVKGKRNRIQKGATLNQAAFSLSDKSTGNGCCSQTANFVKKHDDKDFTRNMDIVVKAAKSVGIIRGPGGSGTGFRVGDKYIMTALHVLVNNIRAMQNPDKIEIDFSELTNKDFYIQFGYRKENEREDPSQIFFFKDLVYKNTQLDTAILKLNVEQGKTIPPKLGIITSLQTDRPVYLIGYPNSSPQMIDPKVEFKSSVNDEVERSIKWATENNLSSKPLYNGIFDNRKVLFHCASQHGASGAVGVMVIPQYEEPVAVLMLLKGFPEFYYSERLSFSNEQKEKFLIVEQGVRLKAIEHDMDVGSEQPRVPLLKKEIFSSSIAGEFQRIDGKNRNGM